MKKKKQWKYLLLIILSLVVAGIVWGVSNQDRTGEVIDPAKKVVIYKSPTCGCCVKYVSYLEDNGYNVEVNTTKDMDSIKSEYGVPVDMESCHTAIFGDYVVEGHIPLEVVDELLASNPEIRGIALPDMPAGSPGMPGTKVEPFKIYSLATTGTEVFGLY